MRNALSRPVPCMACGFNLSCNEALPCQSVWTCSYGPKRCAQPFLKQLELGPPGSAAPPMPCPPQLGAAILRAKKKLLVHGLDQGAMPEHWPPAFRHVISPASLEPRPSVALHRGQTLRPGPANKGTVPMDPVVTLRVRTMSVHGLLKLWQQGNSALKRPWLSLSSLQGNPGLSPR
jgi:hypothetical protein